MIIPEVAPMLTCIQTNDGFQYELLLRATEGTSPITKIRIGPYALLEKYRPKSSVFGLTRGGPENAFLMHKSGPRGWSRLRWEVAENEPGSPTYLVSTGLLKPGTQGMFRFISMQHPGGLRTNLEVWRGESRRDCGVSGPNYEQFMVHDH